MFRIYTTTESLADIEAKEGNKDFEEQSPWYHVLRRQSAIYATHYNPPISDGMIDETDISDSTLAYHLGLSAGIAIINADSFIDEVKQDHSKVLEHPGSAYYLDMPEDEAQDIQKRYGVICHSVHREPDIKEFGRALPFDLEIGAIKKQWKDILKYPKKLPINCLCIIDRNLFSEDGYYNTNDTSQYRTNGMDNVEEILYQLLPDHLDMDFHLSIFIEQNKSRDLSDVELAQDIFAMVEKVKGRRDIQYNILTQIVAFRPNTGPRTLARYSSEITHKRKIISNYFHIEAGDGLNAIRFFAPREGEGKSTQDITVGLLYPYDSLECEEASSYEEIIRTFQKAVNNKWLPYWLGNPETEEYRIISNDRDIDEPCGVEDFKNRLFE